MIYEYLKYNMHHTCIKNSIGRHSELNSIRPKQNLLIKDKFIIKEGIDGKN